MKRVGMDIGQVTLDHEIDTKRFLAAIFEGDDIGAVIRCHFEAEQALDHVLERLTGGRSVRGVSKWKFAQRLEVCHVLGIHENWITPLKILNSHRNDFAHKGLSSIEEQQVLDLYRQTRQLYPNLREDFRLTVTGTRTYDKTYAEASIREKYVFCVMIAVSLFAALPRIEENLRKSTVAVTGM